MCSRQVRQWEVFGCLPSISYEVIIAFLPPSTLRAKHCLVPDLQNERKQRTVWAGEWVFPHSSGVEPQQSLSAVSRLRTRKTGIRSIPGRCHRLWGPISQLPGNSRLHCHLSLVEVAMVTSRGAISLHALCERCSHETKLPFLAPGAHRERLEGCTPVFTASCAVQLPSLLVLFCIFCWRGLWLSDKTMDRACTNTCTLKAHAWADGKQSGKEKLLG